MILHRSGLGSQWRIESPNIFIAIVGNRTVRQSGVYVAVGHFYCHFVEMLFSIQVMS